jgi:hypothetical protein
LTVNNKYIPIEGVLNGPGSGIEMPIGYESKGATREAQYPLECRSIGKTS